SGYGFSDEELQHIMVEEAKLWLDSGKIFGPATAQFERFNIACPRSTVVKAMEQLKEAMDKHEKWEQ
ncbi:aminotransferase, partial [Streptococcus suis]